MSAPLAITFRQAKDAGACDSAYRKMIRHVGTTEKYGRDTPMPIETVLDVCGLDDAIWGLSAIGAVRILRLWSCDCAERVLPIFERVMPGDLRPRRAILAQRRFVRGEIGDAAGDAAWAARDAAGDAARDAVWDARGAAGHAAWAAARAAWAAEEAWQIDRLREYLRGDR
jgi:hypothetical protein